MHACVGGGDQEKVSGSLSIVRFEKHPETALSKQSNTQIKIKMLVASWSFLLGFPRVFDLQAEDRKALRASVCRSRPHSLVVTKIGNDIEEWHRKGNCRR